MHNFFTFFLGNYIFWGATIHQINSRPPTSYFAAGAPLRVERVCEGGWVGGKDACLLLAGQWAGCCGGEGEDV